MDISIGSYKVRVEILVAIVVIFWILFGHLLCGCCRMNLFEGFREGLKLKKLKKAAPLKKQQRYLNHKKNQDQLHQS